MEKMHRFCFGHDKIPSQVKGMMMDKGMMNRSFLGEGRNKFGYKEALSVSGNRLKERACAKLEGTTQFSQR